MILKELLFISLLQVDNVNFLFNIHFSFINVLLDFKGSFRPPFGGFKNNPITLSKITNVDKLPIAHTWFLA